MESKLVFSKKYSKGNQGNINSKQVKYIKGSEQTITSAKEKKKKEEPNFKEL